MQLLKHRSVRSLLAAAAAFTGASCVAPSAFAGMEGSPVTVPSSHAEALDAAVALRSQGNLVRARDILMPLVQRDGGVSLPDDARRRAFDLLSALNREIQSLPAAELALQKAEAAFASSDLAAAESHAKSVANLPGANAATIDRAIALLDKVGTERASVADRIPVALAEARIASEAGDMVRAKSLLESVVRSGVVLTPEQRADIDLLQRAVIDHEDGAGEMLQARPVALGLLQPGVVKRRDQAPAPAADDQPGTQPPAERPASQPAPQAQPAPETQPEQPAAQPAEPTPPPSNQDLIQQARAFESQSLIAEADLAFNERRLNEAANKYARLQSEYRDLLTPAQSSHINARLTETRLLLRGNVGAEQDIIQSVISQNQFAKQATVAEFNNLMEQARRLLAAENVADARLQALKARLTLNAARQYFAETEYQGLYQQTADILTQIETTEDRLRTRQITEQEKAFQADARAQAESLARDRERKINENIDRVRALQLEMKYREALQVVDQILFLDPINPAGLVLKDVLTGMLIYQEHHLLEAEGDVRQARLHLQTKEAALAPAGVVNYPTDWPAISFRRGETAAFRETPENQSVLAKLDQPIPARFTNNPLSDVVAYLQTLSQLEIDVDWAALEEIGVDQTTPVTLNLTKVPMRVVLDRALEKASPDRLSRASWAVNDGILQISSDEALRQNTILAIYDIRDLLIEIPDYDNAPEFDLSQVLQQGQGGGGGGGQSPFQDSDNEDEENRVPLEERRQQIIDIITQNIDFEGWTDNGGDTGRIQPLAGSLIIVNTARNHREIGGLLSKLREQRALQINVETRFLLVSSGFFEQIGFDLDVYFNANNNQIRTARANDPTIQTSDFFDFAGTGLNRSVTGAQAPAGPTTSPAGTQLTQGVVNPRAWSPIGAGQNSLGLASSLLTGTLPEGSVGSAALGAAPALGVAGQFLDDIQVDFLVRATQADRRSVQLTAPRLTFTNGQRSNIVVATQVAFIADLTPVTSDSAVGFDPQIASISEGVRLVVDGTVSADRRYVTLNVSANVATLEGFAERPVTAVAGGQLVSSADTQSFVQLPTITSTQVSTTVTVPDQGTILLGGQRLLTEVEVETGVPVLSKIPILNRFFTNRIESTEEQTLLILLKPTILIQNEEEERNFPGLGDAARAGLAG